MDDSTRDEQEKAREQAQDRAQEKGTEATFFDPFADDDDEPEIDLADLLGTPAPASSPDDAGEDSAATSATPFDPFADDEDSDPGAAGGGDSGQDAGERSRREALSTFRQRRGTSRAGADIAGGMVRLPFLPSTDPVTAVIDPADEIAKVMEAPTLNPGDIVAGQYEVIRTIAHDGMGWI